MSIKGKLFLLSGHFTHKNKRDKTLTRFLVSMNLQGRPEWFQETEV